MTKFRKPSSLKQGRDASDGGDEVDGSDRRRGRREFKRGKLPINLMLAGYYNLVKPTYGADWQLRSQVTLIF